jgi:Arc/MetJ-type ribon-helix-helix transcriptional regulator
MTQIAVKLPDDLVKAVDELVASGVYESRSSAVRRALQAAVAQNRREAVDRSYEVGYAQVPESAQEMDDARRLARQAIEDEPWDKWW